MRKRKHTLSSFKKDGAATWIVDLNKKKEKIDR